MKVFFQRIRKITEVDCITLYKRLFTQGELISKLAERITLPDEIEQIIADTKLSLSKVQMSYEDISPLLYLKLKLEGSDTYSDIRQVVIDIMVSDNVMP